MRARSSILWLVTAQGSDGAAGEEADRYELALRKRDARATLAIGVLLLVLSVVALIGWYLLYTTGTDFALIRNGGLVLVAGGAWTLYSGFRKRARARSFERAIPSGSSGARG